MNLHRAIQNGSSLIFMEQLIKKHPESLLRTAFYGAFPFHTAIEFIPNPDEAVEVLKLLLSYDPEAATRCDSRGNLPLHIATGESLSSNLYCHVDVCELVFDAFPDAAAAVNHCGRTPLHCAVIREDVTCVHLLLERYPECARVKDRQDCLPLHLALLEPWLARGPRIVEIIRLLLAAYPDGTEHSMGLDDREFFPIHLACNGSYCRRVVEMLLDVNAGSVYYSLQVDRYGLCNKQPLIAAIEADCDLDVIELLIDRTTAPGSLLAWSNNSMRPAENLTDAWPAVLPLHIAMNWWCHLPTVINLDMVQLLIDRCPEALATVVHTDGGVTLHHEIAKQVRYRESDRVRLLEMLLEGYGDSVRRADSMGRLPLHVACAHDISREAFALLVDRYPAALHAKDKQGRLPLHVMMMTRCVPLFPAAAANLKLLIARYPEALVQANNDCALPVHSACKSRQSLLILQILVEAAPATVHAVSKDGSIPLFVATEHYEDSLDAIYYLVQRSPELFLRESNSSVLSTK